MTFSQAKDALGQAYREKAARSLASMRREPDAGDVLRDGRQFVKHAGVRLALHLHWIKTGRLPPEMGRFYEDVFAGRTKADYEVASGVSAAEARELANQAERFVSLIQELLNKPAG